MTASATVDPSLRPNPAMVITFADRGGATITIAGQQVRLRVNAAALSLLAAIADPSGEQLALLGERFDGDSVVRAVDTLRRAGVLVAPDNEPTLVESWREWGEAAWLPHLMTKDVAYEADVDRLVARSAPRPDADPPPSPYKCCCEDGRDCVRLPEPALLSDISFSEVLLRRRTVRWYLRRPLELQQLADLLFYTGGPLFEQDAGEFGTVIKKCSPSPGARHATEIYCVVSRGGALAEGIYHYCTLHHSLVSLPTSPEFDTACFLRRAFVGQEWFAQAPVAFFLTCVRDRLAWKYSSPRTYRVAHFESGHYCQTLLLAAAAHGLGAFTTAALGDSHIEAALGIDGIGEFVMYAAGVGHPSRHTDDERRVLALSPHLPRGARVTLPDGSLVAIAPGSEDGDE